MTQKAECLHATAKRKSAHRCGFVQRALALINNGAVLLALEVLTEAYVTRRKQLLDYGAAYAGCAQ